MADLSRRQLFAMGAAAAVAPVLPAVAKAAPLPMLTIRLPSAYVAVAPGNRLLTPAEFGRDALLLYRKHFPNSPTGLSEFVDNG